MHRSRLYNKINKSGMNRNSSRKAVEKALARTVDAARDNLSSSDEEDGRHDGRQLLEEEEDTGFINDGDLRK